MSALDENNGRPERQPDEQSILANLPHTRPQRSSPRRAAARRAAAGAKPAPVAGERPPVSTNGGVARKPAAAGPATSRAGKPAKAAAGTPAKAATAKAGAPSRAKAGAKAKAGSPRAAKRATAGARSPRPSASSRPAKRAADEVPRQGYESELDRARGPVQPPGGAELVASAAEIIGELAKAGISTGERLVRDALSRLPLS